MERTVRDTYEQYLARWRAHFGDSYIGVHDGIPMGRFTLRQWVHCTQMRTDVAGVIAEAEAKAPGERTKRDRDNLEGGPSLLRQYEAMLIL